MQCQPIAINGTLYFTTANINVVAVAGATGKERWRTDLSDYWKGENAWAGTNRGVTYWKEGEDQRIFVSAGPNLFCLDARTGKPVESFGSQGKIDLQEDLDYDQKSFFIVSNTPGIIYKDVIIMGMRLSEGLDAAPGHVRAYDVRTGKRRWIFHTIPKPGEFGYDTWQDKRNFPSLGALTTGRA
ncbi:PQQ-binding-like beta-propeller repeat protein [Siphonobacter sp. BAB-5385]|uniref:outer membrane protein assembly factor BamB family protein n=1 Tax=Siphonobacter sp. BAB-5385 TaxID=1864822 RepID=UPI0020CBD26F|nr:PQQ-binding-like beta-propeller repeat protein [Siphonobacter sp. BAB-5385]